MPRYLFDLINGDSVADEVGEEFDGVCRTAWDATTLRASARACALVAATAIDDFSVGHNLPIPVAGRTFPGDPIRKCAFLSHDDESRRVGLYPLKVPVVCLLAYRAIILFVACRPTRCRGPPIAPQSRVEGLDNPLTRTVDAGTEQKYPVLLEYAKAPFERIKQRLRHL
jgi:hypothetical protein